MHLHRSRLFTTLMLRPALCLTLLAGCGSAKKNEVEPSPTNLSGYVRNAAGAPVAQALVSSGDGSQKATTDDAGHYELGVSAAALNGGALRAAAQSYSTMFRSVAPQAPTQDFVLRPFDSETTVMLPKSGEAPAVAIASRSDGTVKLNIPGAALVTASGAVAAGEAKVKLAYWNPINDTNNVPTPMVARLPKGTDGVGPYDLAMQTLGMVDIQITQGDEQLQVAPGKSLTLDHLVPPAVAAGMAQRPNDMPNPYMFYFNSELNRWQVDGKLSWDGNTGVMQGELPHLTIWNFDNFQNWMPPAHCTSDQIAYAQTPDCSKPQNSSVGGCMSGIALKKNGDPYANSKVRMYLFDNENISAIDVATDAAGRYCANIGTRLCIPIGNNKVNCNYSENTVSYLISGLDSPDTSSMKNPIPTQCRGSGGSFPAMNYVSSCGLIADPEKGAPAPVKPLSTPATASIRKDTSCNNTKSCAVLPDVTIDVDVPKTDGGQPPKPNPCETYLPIGAQCTATQMPNRTCCVTGTTCEDYVCVPPK